MSRCLKPRTTKLITHECNKSDERTCYTAKARKKSQMHTLVTCTYNNHVYISELFFTARQESRPRKIRFCTGFVRAIYGKFNLCYMCTMVLYQRAFLYRLVFFINVYGRDLAKIRVSFNYSSRESFMKIYSN